MRAGVWKGRVSRGWRKAERPKGLTGKALADMVRSMALRYPSNVRIGKPD